VNLMLHFPMFDSSSFSTLHPTKDAFVSIQPAAP
jgi:hypothetical protein